MEIVKEYRGLKNQRITYVFYREHPTWPSFYRFEWNIDKKKEKFPVKNFMRHIWKAYWACKPQ